MGSRESKYEVMSDLVSIEELYQHHYLNWIEEKWDEFEFQDIDILRFKKGSKNVYDNYLAEYSKSNFPVGIKAKIFFFVLTILTYLYFQGKKIDLKNKLFTISHKNLFMMMIVCEEYNIPDDIINVILHLVKVNKKFVDISYIQVLERQLKRKREYPVYLSHFQHFDIADCSSERIRTKYNQELFMEYFLKGKKIDRSAFINKNGMCEFDFLSISNEGISLEDVKNIMIGFEEAVLKKYYGIIIYKLKSNNNILSFDDAKLKKVKSVSFNSYNIFYYF